MSFLKFSEIDKNYDWHRAKLDGAPFKAKQNLLLKEEEIDRLAEKVHNANTAIFDISNKDQVECGRTYQQVLDGVLAGWFILLTERKYQWVEKDGKSTMLVYVEWSEPVMRLPASIEQSVK